MYTPFSAAVNRKLGIILIMIGVILTPDIIIPTFTDIINFTIAMPLSDIMGISYTLALYYTFMAGFAFMGIGFLIYPYNTKRMVVGRVRSAWYWVKSNPFMFIGALLLFYVVWAFMNQWNEAIYQYAKDMIFNI